jgi:hypothetical protein
LIYTVYPPKKAGEKLVNNENQAAKSRSLRKPTPELFTDKPDLKKGGE